MEKLTSHKRGVAYYSLCSVIVFTPILTFVLVGAYVGKPVMGNEAEYWAAVPSALPLALAIALIIGVGAGCFLPADM
jgi:hypothetical protein